LHIELRIWTPRVLERHQLDDWTRWSPVRQIGATLGSGNTCPLADRRSRIPAEPGVRNTAPVERATAQFRRVTPHSFRRSSQLSYGMPLINVVVTLILVGVVLWLINTYIPMQATIKKILNIVVVIVVVLWLLYGFGVINNSGDIRLPS
jgi:hypothetical protein